MNCLREARLVTAAMMIGVALAGGWPSGRRETEGHDEARHRCGRRGADLGRKAEYRGWPEPAHRRARRQDGRGQADGQDGQPRPGRQGD